MAEGYYRLVCFLVNICPQPLRGLFLKYAKLESGATFTTLDAYLAKKRQAITNLYNTKKIRDDQLDLIYPQCRSASESEWDVTLLATLITKLFASNLQGFEIVMMNEIREIRNNLQHSPNTSALSESVFNDFWTRLETATLFLAKSLGGSSYENEIAERISNTKVINFPYLVESLRAWYEENRKQMSAQMQELKATIEEMRKEMINMKAKVVDSNFNTEQTLSMLEKTIVKNKGPAGSTTKRFKTVDSILSRLKANFDRTMNTELRQDFSSPPEVADICTRLRDKHHVVVTGSDGSRYVELALAAIKEMEYTSSRCVEIWTSTDWRHIDPEDVDLVLCRDPFGTSCYEEKKAKSMADIFKNMLYTTKEEDEADRIDVIFVTNLSFLSEFNQRNYSEILEEVVTVFESTTEKQPHDLTTGCMVSHIITKNNVKEMTELFLQKYTEGSKLVDADTLMLARKEFQKNKIVVITGPRRCGKTSFAVKLAESCEQKKFCRLLYNPDDVRYIDFNNPCLVIVDEFAGKYRYEEDDVYNWYKSFDLLYDASIAGKLNVIVTVEKEKLHKCCREIAEHDLLKHRVDLSDSIFVVKDESVEDRGNGDIHLTTKEPDVTITNNPLVRRKSKRPGLSSDRLQPSADIIKPEPDELHPTVWSVAKKEMYDISMLKEENFKITGSCQLPSGEGFIADQANFRLKKLDTSYKVIAECNFQDFPRDVCYIDNNLVVVSAYTSFMFIDIVGMKITRACDTEHICSGLASHGNLLYVVGRDSVYLYSTDGIKQRVQYTYIDSHFFHFAYIAVSDDGSKIYISRRHKLTTVDNFGNHLYTIKDPHLGLPGGLCLDGKGHVMVAERVSGNITQISADGRHKLGTVAKTTYSTGDVLTIYFDRQRSRLICGGNANTLTVLQLKCYRITTDHMELPSSVL